jgi:hypothetical protein
MPVIQVAEASPIVQEQPISRAGSTAGVSAFLPGDTPTAPVVPVYPRKQARH